MFIELVDSLRCPRDHDDTWLVATVLRRDERRIVDGILGCPTCFASWPVREGVADFRVTARDPDAHAVRTAAEPSGDDVVRLAALLHLVEPGGVVVLGGRWARLAAALAELSRVQVATLNAGAADGDAELVSALAVDERLPFRRHAVRAIALDDDTATGSLLASAADALRGGARVVLPAHVAPPLWARELARDERDVVLEREAVASAVVTLERRRG